MQRKLAISLFFIMFFCNLAVAQIYPVQVNTMIRPPFTPFLSDYTAPGSQKLMVNFMLQDPTLVEYRGRLRITIEGVGITIRTKPTFIPQPLVLPGGGVPLLLYGEDLAEYFHPNNLDFQGITRREYEKGSRLPEGVYRFSIEVLDYNRGTLVSNRGTATAWIILNDPPILNLPRNDSKARILDPTNLVFTWTPRHTGSPNSAFSTEYTFRLVELWPLNRNPYDAFLSQPPLYEIKTLQTQIVYGPAEPALIPGRKYAWQVQAMDVDGRDLFKNQGKSEVYVFQFGEALGIPENLYLQSANASTLTVRWEQQAAGNPDPIQFRVRYRPHRNRTSPEWYEASTTDQWKALAQLQPDTEYEVQVRAEQGPQRSEYTPFQVYRTAPPGRNAFACKADVAPPPPADPNIPSFGLMINDTIKAGGYSVVVRQVTGANGKYSGEGVAIVPWFNAAKVRVTFENINVNGQNWLTAGVIKSVWNPESKFLKNIEKPTTTPGGQTPQAGEIAVTVVATDSLVEITGAAIATVTKDENGNIVVQTTDGQTQVLEGGNSYSIVDEIGNGYVVDKEGNIVKTSATEATAAHSRGDRDYNLAIKFEKGDGIYGFDEKQYDALTQYYQQLDANQFVPWKAVSASRSDQMKAILQGSGVDSEKVRFEVNGAPLVPTATSGQEFTLSVVGKSNGITEELLALYNPTDSAETEQVLGKVNLISYAPVSNNLVIVPVNQNQLPGNVSVASIETELNAIYGQAVADWKVSLAPTLNVTLGEIFDDGESGLLTNYSTDMKKVINAYGNFQPKTYYVFLVDKPRSGSQSMGYMPRSKQAGFIYVDNTSRNQNSSRTIAHEIGHGAFSLKHTFSEFPGLSQGTTDNLMDYNQGAHLHKYQWDYVHEPQTVIGLFEDDDDGKGSTILNPDDNNLYISLASNEVFTDEDELDNDNRKDRYYRDEVIVLPEGTWKFNYERKMFNIYSVDVNNNLTGHDFIVDPGDIKQVNADNAINFGSYIDWRLSQDVQGVAPIDYQNQSSLELQLIAGNYILEITQSPLTAEIQAINNPAVPAGKYRLGSDQPDLAKCEIRIKVVRSPLIEFEPNGFFEGKYGYDPMVLTGMVQLYDTMRNSQGSYPVSWLSGQVGQDIDLIAKYTISEGKPRDYSISFTADPPGSVLINGLQTFSIPRNNRVLKSGQNNISLSINIQSRSLEMERPYIKLMATFDYDDENNAPQAKIGQLHIISEELSNFVLSEYVLVQVSTGSPNNVANINTIHPIVHQYFNERSFNQAFVRWEGSTDSIVIPEEEIAEHLNASGEVMDASISDFFDNVQQFYVDNANVVDGKHYIFVVDRNAEPKADGSFTEGDGSLGIVINGVISKRMFSVIFYSAMNKADVYVHEVGHNFSLDHADEEPYNIQRGSTYNFMDYSRISNMFWKFQWDRLRNAIFD